MSFKGILAILPLALISGLLAGEAAAQNTSSVFGPKVRDGAASADYRFGYVPGENGAPDRYAHRIAGGFSLDERRAVSLVLRGTDRGGPAGFEYDYMQAQFSWEASPEDAAFWSTGFRFDARLANGDRPDQLGANWTNQFELSDRVSARAILLTAVQSGERAADGVLLAARGQVSYDLGGGASVALLSFNSLGSTEDFGTGGRSQQLGPVVTGRIAGDWTWTFGNLFGLNEATPDNDVRLWIGRSF